MGKRLTTKQFIQKAKKVHGETYDYSKVYYINNKTKVIIKCHTHGDFEQIPNRHLLNGGCNKCGGTQRLTTKECINKFKKVHKNKYNYNHVNYISSKTKVAIKCSEHGIFKQTPNVHLSGAGCPNCGTESQVKKQTLIKDILRDLTISIRKNITNSYSRKKYTKKSKTAQILGCTWQEFKEHLENNPYGFKISDSNMDLDHIIPISSAKTEQELIKLNHYTNFQLLPKEYNRWIKSCNLFDKEHFNEWLAQNKKEICQEY